MNILISGPLRPSVSVFIENLKNVRKNFPGSKIFLSTWKSFKSGGTFNREDDKSKIIENEEFEVIRKSVDHILILDEPENHEILKKIKSRTQQQLKFPETDEWNMLSTCNIYKMFLGIRLLTEYIDRNNLINRDEFVCRYRTDLYLNFDIQEIRNNENYYVIARETSGVQFDDWFCVCNYENFKKVWTFESDLEYDNYVSTSWNVEDIIKNKVLNNKIKYTYLNKISEVYLIRDEKIWGKTKYF